MLHAPGIFATSPGGHDFFMGGEGAREARVLGGA